jgi:hypothetical protein
LVWRFVGQDGAEGPEAVEILYGAAVKTVALRLIAEEYADGVGLELAHHAVEAGGQPVALILAGGDLYILGDLAFAEYEGRAGGFHGFIEAVGKEARLQGGAAEEGVLGESDALDGEELLGVGGLEESDEIVAKVGDGFGLFELDDGELVGGEAVFAGVLGRPGGGWHERVDLWLKLVARRQGGIRRRGAGMVEIKEIGARVCCHWGRGTGASDFPRGRIGGQNDRRKCGRSVPSLGARHCGR